MPLEFALRPRFDLKRPAPRRRLSGLSLHPLVVPVGAYWLAAVGLTYALVRSAEADVAEAADVLDVAGTESSNGDAASTETVADEPVAMPSPLSSITAPVQTPPPPEPEPDSILLSEPPGAEPPTPQALHDVASLSAADMRRDRARQAPPRAVEDEQRAESGLPRMLEPSTVEEPTLARADEERGVSPPRPEQAPERQEQTGPLPSCESAAATANQTIEVGSSRGAPDLTRGAFAGVLEHGAYLTQCSIPPRTAVEICAAVQNGSVVGVTVVTEPRDATINGCVRRAVAKLRFPRSPQLDVTRTRFASER